MLSQKRLKALLANQHFYVEDEYHIFDETDSCPAIKVNNFILKIIPNVFPENYKPISKSEKPKGQDKVRVNSSNFNSMSISSQLK